MNEFEKKLKQHVKDKAAFEEQRAVKEAERKASAQAERNERYVERQRLQNENLVMIKPIHGEVLDILQQANNALFDGKGFTSQKIGGETRNFDPGGDGSAFTQARLRWNLKESFMVRKSRGSIAQENYEPSVWVKSRAIIVQLRGFNGVINMEIAGGETHWSGEMIHKTIFNSFGTSEKVELENILLDTLIYHPGKCDVSTDR